MPIVITDSGANVRLTATSTLTISVGDENDNAHRPAEKLIELYRYQAAPASTADSTNAQPPLELGRVACEDPDDWDWQEKTYRWLGDVAPSGAAGFRLDEQTGMLSVQADVHENEYRMRVNVSDAKFGSAICNVTVWVHVIEDFLILNSASFEVDDITMDELVEPGPDQGLSCEN